MNFMPISDVRSSADSGAANPPVTGSSVATKENFLQLLVAQIKNQNPLNPTDGTQFLSQLSQFTEMEQMLGMRQDIAAIRTALTAAKPTTPETES